MLTNNEAMKLSKIIAEAPLFVEARKQLTRDLLDYYKALLYRKPQTGLQVVRRMF